jgi:hypothetical protein
MQDPRYHPDRAKLTQKQRAKVKSWLDAKTPLIGKCSVCGERHWLLLEHLIFAPVYYPRGTIVNGGPNYPCVGMLCTNCGNTQFLNAVMIGVDERQPDDFDDLPVAAPEATDG